MSWLFPGKGPIKKQKKGNKAKKNKNKKAKV
jgi:hypothetical protein